MANLPAKRGHHTDVAESTAHKGKFRSREHHPDREGNQITQWTCMTLPTRTIPEIEIIEEHEEETELEPLYRVIIHNDDVTPMDFVIRALTNFFYLSNPKAAEIMLTAHFSGMAYVQSLPKSEAEKRINKAHFAAGLEGYPLHFSMEPE